MNPLDWLAAAIHSQRRQNGSEKNGMRRLAMFLFCLVQFVGRGYSQIYGNPLVNWDFSDGIPSEWQVGISSTNNLAHWEYRGPLTIPNTDEGARGSCSAIASPISSQTQDNGFIIFDGNYWDDPGMACGAGFGTGPDPAPHTAWVITNPVDLSSIPSAVLTFQQQYRHFQATTTVHISTDDGSSWIEILSNPGIQSPAAEWKSINISEWAANQPNVRFKFQYEGTYYWWILDDISVYQPNDNDILLTQVRYTNNTVTNGLTTLTDLEYNQYPLAILPALKFKSDILNVGGNSQTGVRLNARVVKDGTTEVYNQSNSPSALAVSAAATLSMTGTFTPLPNVGDYSIYYRILQDSIDDSPFNNIDSLDFEITTFTYGKDEGTMEDTYVPEAFYDEYKVACGNYFENKNTLRYCHTVQVGIAEGTSVGKEIRGVVYNESLDTLIGYTEPYMVNYGDLNEPGEERLVYLDFETPFELQADSIYFFAVEELDSILPFYVARGGKSFGESSLIRYDNINASIVSGKSFMVRLTVLPLNQQPGCLDAQAINFESSADVDDGSCDYLGCTNEDADNFVAAANYDDGTCQVGGCVDSTASNYNPFATYQNINCIFRGCTLNNALNFNPQANEDDGTCELLYATISAQTLSGCPPFQLQVANNNTFNADGLCVYTIDGVEVYDVCSSQFDYIFDSSGIYELSYSIVIGNSVADTTLTIEVFETSSPPVLSYDDSSHELNCLNCSDANIAWYFNGVLVNQSESASFDTELDGITQNGSYQLITTNAFGCSTASEPLVVVQPHMTLSSTGGCAPFSVYINNLTDTISGLICSLNTGLSTLENFTEQVEVVYTTAGPYTVTITCNALGDSAEVSNTINVYDLEVPTLIIDEVNASVVCSNSSSFTNFVWNVDGVISIGGTSQPLGGDVYQLQASNSNGCGGSNLLIVNNTGELANELAAVFPNPANGFIQFTRPTAAAFRILNVFGSIVFESTVGSAMEMISTEHLPNGLYYILWLNNGTSSTLKFEISH